MPLVPKVRESVQSAMDYAHTVQLVLEQLVISQAVRHIAAANATGVPAIREPRQRAGLPPPRTLCPYGSQRLWPLDTVSGRHVFEGIARLWDRGYAFLRP